MANTIISENQWGDGLALGHDGAISHLSGFLREHLGEHWLAVVGHRVVHGGLGYVAQQSGLLGVSGLSSDMRTLPGASDPQAKFAVELFVSRIGRELGSLAATLG